MKWKLFLDDERYPTTNDWHIARNMDDAVWYCRNYGVPYEIAFDHDLGAHKHSGMDFCKWFCNWIMDNEIPKPDNFVFTVHSMNPVGAENIRTYMSQFIEDYW